MKIILTETVESLGIIGTEVEVADGYARNYLFPQNKAVPDTPKNRKILEQNKAKFELQIAKEREFAEEMAKRLDGVTCEIIAKVSEDDRLYGSVSIGDILDVLSTQDVEVEKRMVILSSPIKTIGTFKVPIRIYSGVEAEITVEVKPEE